MFVNLSYDELLQISSALMTISAVYGNYDAECLKRRIDTALEMMDNLPVTEVYPDLCRDVGTVST